MGAATLTSNAKKWQHYSIPSSGKYTSQHKHKSMFRSYCMGWKPIIAADCVRMREFEHRSEAQRKAAPTTIGNYRTYTGGGYELR